MFQDELSHVKRLLQETEETCQIEAERRKEAANQVIKLTELKALLQQQIEEKGGGTVAKKQVKSLETRLRITEERLHNERADRAGKLSEVENKLLSENARLQVKNVTYLKYTLTYKQESFLFNKNIQTGFYSDLYRNISGI